MHTYVHIHIRVYTEDPSRCVLLLCSHYCENKQNAIFPTDESPCYTPISPREEAGSLSPSNRTITSSSGSYSTWQGFSPSVYTTADESLLPKRDCEICVTEPTSDADTVQHPALYEGPGGASPIPGQALVLLPSSLFPTPWRAASSFSHRLPLALDDPSIPIHHPLLWASTSCARMSLHPLHR